MRLLCLSLVALRVSHNYAEGCIDYLNLTSNPDVKCYYGFFDNPYSNQGCYNGRHTVIKNRYKDSYSNQNVPLYSTPAEGKSSIRLGDSKTGAQAEAISFKYEIPAKPMILMLRYAVVLQDPEHSVTAQPRFTLQIQDKSGKSLDADCFDADFIPGKNTDEWEYGFDEVRYKDWTSLEIDLEKYAGETINIVLTTFDCSESGHFGYAYFSLEDCVDKMIEVQACVEDNIVKFLAPDGFFYEWTKEGEDAILSTNQVYEVMAEDPSRYICKIINKENPACFSHLYSEVSRFDPLVDAVGTLATDNVVSFVNRTTVKRVYGDGHFTISDIASSKGLSFEWDFGDGETSNEVSPVHTYKQGGVYNVTLTARMFDKCDREWHTTIKVARKWLKLRQMVRLQTDARCPRLGLVITRIIAETRLRM